MMEVMINHSLQIARMLNNFRELAFFDDLGVPIAIFSNKTPNWSS